MIFIWAFQQRGVSLAIATISCSSYSLSIRKVKEHVYIQDAVNFQGSEKLDKYILALIADHSSSTDRSNYPEIIKLNEMGRWSTAPELASE